MNIRKEIHCARMHRRFTFPLSISLDGQVFPLVNWSEGGVLVSMPGGSFQKDQRVSGELMIPCLDGMYSLPVELCPLRKTEEGWACQFVDMPPRELGILRFFIEIVLRGGNVLMAELDGAGRIARNPAPKPPGEPSSGVQASSGNLARLIRVPLKYALLIASLVFVISLLGYLIVPYIAGNVWQKLSKASNMETVAQSRIVAANLALQDLDNKIAGVENLLRGSMSGQEAQGEVTLRPEQKHALEIGLAQLLTEREMAQVHLQVLEANLELIRKGDFLIEESVFSGYNTDVRLTTPPYLSDILTDLAAGSRMTPQTPEDREKFARIADARLAQAQHNLEAARVKRQTLETIVERAEKAAAASAIPQNTLDLMKRDLELLRIEEQRLDDIILLLEENVKAVREGNFTYELQLLQKFDPRIGPGISTQESPTVQ